MVSISIHTMGHDRHTSVHRIRYVDDTRYLSLRIRRVHVPEAYKELTSAYALQLAGQCILEGVQGWEDAGSSGSECLGIVLSILTRIE